jgi:hypothetical protein
MQPRQGLDNHQEGQHKPDDCTHGQRGQKNGRAIKSRRSFEAKPLAQDRQDMGGRAAHISARFPGVSQGTSADE